MPVPHATSCDSNFDAAKNKRPSGAQPQKSPGRMTGRLLRLWVWELFPTRQKAKRIYAAPACDLASGGLFALLAAVRL